MRFYIFIALVSIQCFALTNWNVSVSRNGSNWSHSEYVGNFVNSGLEDQGVVWIATNSTLLQEDGSISSPYHGIYPFVVNNSSGCTYMVMPGRYVIDDTLYFTNGVCTMVANGDVTLVLNHQNKQSVIVSENGTLTMSGFKITGDLSVGDWSYDNAFSSSEKNKLIIEDCAFFDITNNTCAGLLTGATIKNSTFDSISSIYPFSNANFYDCLFSHIYMDDVNYYSYNTFNACSFYGCKMSDISSITMMFYGVSFETRYVLKNCELRRCVSSILEPQFGAVFHAIENNQFYECFVSNTYNVPGSDLAFVALDNGPYYSNSYAIGNTFIGCQNVRAANSTNYTVMLFDGMNQPPILFTKNVFIDCPDPYFIEKHWTTNIIKAAFTCNVTNNVFVPFR